VLVVHPVGETTVKCAAYNVAYKVILPIGGNTVSFVKGDLRVRHLLPEMFELRRESDHNSGPLEDTEVVEDGCVKPLMPAPVRLLCT
jgi:hypothetical protein